MPTPAVPFGVVATVVADAYRALDCALVDVDRYEAPSECGGVVVRAAARALVRVLAQYGFTPAAFDRELAARTSPKYAFTFGSAETFAEPAYSRRPQ